MPLVFPISLSHVLKNRGFKLVVKYFGVYGAIRFGQHEALRPDAPLQSPRIRNCLLAPHRTAKPGRCTSRVTLMSMGKFGSLEICGLRYVTFWMDVVVLSGRCLDAEVSSVAITSRVSYIADAH
jgi:hypothetical protein